MNGKEKLQYCHYYTGEISAKNMHSGLAVPLKDGTRVLIRDRYEPNVWLSGSYQLKRWPNEDGSVNAGVQLDLPLTETQWLVILEDDEVILG